MHHPNPRFSRARRKARTRNRTRRHQAGGDRNRRRKHRIYLGARLGKLFSSFILSRMKAPSILAIPKVALEPGEALAE